jgi:glycosyltransferase involved in cell wall biosynthesis
MGPANFYSEKTAVFTICSNNYLAYAVTLLKSVKKFHPDLDCFLCLVDEKLTYPSLYEHDFDVVLARELEIPDFYCFSFQYDVLELNTAVKPYMFLRLFDRKYRQVIYFDPDIEIFGRLDVVLSSLSAGASFVVTPHLCSPAENDVDIDDTAIMRAGTFNLGFLACTNQPQTVDILHWWARRLRFQCVVRPDIGIFVDQKFVDLMPGFVDGFTVLRDETMNVAYWNIAQRSLTQKGDDFYVNGRPLTFYHFSGIEPNNYTMLSKHTKMFRKDSLPAPVRALMARYFENLVENGLGKVPAGEYSYGKFVSGTPIHKLVRRMFRETSLPWTGNPFENYEEYLQLPHIDASRNSSSFIVTNFMKYLWDQYQWAQQFDIRLDPHVESFVRWYSEHAGPQLVLDPRLIEPVSVRAGRLRFPSKNLSRRENGRPDVTVVGYLKMAGGTGQAARQTLKALASTDLRVDGHDVAHAVIAKRDDTTCDFLLAPKVSGRVQIFHINADQLPHVRAHLAPLIRQDSYRIAVPFWELSEFPSAYYSAFDDIDEVWAPSRFIQLSLFRKVPGTITYMPIPLSIQTPTPYERAHFSLPPDKFLFYFGFDFLSYQSRKNPRAVYEAFTEAFKANGGHVGLVVKTINGEHASGDLASLRDELLDDPAVTLIDQTLSHSELLSLIATCNCVVSLHRSEGLGLLIAEAMMLKKPVIATDYSGTTQFVTPETGFPVDYSLIPVKDGEYPFAGGRWADPDIHHAAWLMRKVYGDPASAEARAERGRQLIEQNYGPKHVASLQRRRLCEIGLA